MQLMTDGALPALYAIGVERDARLQSKPVNVASVPETLRSLPRLSPDDASTAQRAFRVATGLSYKHVGLSTAEYLAHPVRVAQMVSQLDPESGVDGVVLALLHNVLELTNANPDVVGRDFGAQILDGITVLTVDRARADHVYKVEYYGSLQSRPRFVRVVKALDKLDNLFVLGLNPDAEVRHAYLAEIEEFIVPMVAEVMPHLTGYLRELIVDTRATGQLSRAPRQ